MKRKRHSISWTLWTAFSLQLAQVAGEEIVINDRRQYKWPEVCDMNCTITTKLRRNYYWDFPIRWKMRNLYQQIEFAFQEETMLPNGSTSYKKGMRCSSNTSNNGFEYWCEVNFRGFQSSVYIALEIVKDAEVKMDGPRWVGPGQSAIWTCKMHRSTSKVQTFWGFNNGTMITQGIEQLNTHYSPDPYYLNYFNKESLLYFYENTTGLRMTIPEGQTDNFTLMCFTIFTYDNGYRVTRPEAFYEVGIEDNQVAYPCWSSPCQNNGTCTDEHDQYNCTCPDNYVGTNCEVAVTTTPSWQTSTGYVWKTTPGPPAKTGMSKGQTPGKSNTGTIVGLSVLIVFAYAGALIGISCWWKRRQARKNEVQREETEHEPQGIQELQDTWNGGDNGARAEDPTLPSPHASDEEMRVHFVDEAAHLDNSEDSCHSSATDSEVGGSEFGSSADSIPSERSA